MAKWQQKYRVDWDATDGRNGGSSADSLETSDGNGEVQIPSRRRRFGNSGLGAGLSCNLGLGDAFQLPMDDIAGAVWFLRAPKASAV